MQEIIPLAIDIRLEKLVSLSEAARSLPPIDGHRPHSSTIWRWIRRGSRGIHLEHVRLGRRTCTSVEALSRFVNALAAADEQMATATERQQTVKPRTDTQKEKAIAIAASELARDGI
jgi:hypothetical protein